VFVVLCSFLCLCVCVCLFMFNSFVYKFYFFLICQLTVVLFFVIVEYCVCSCQCWCMCSYVTGGYVRGRVHQFFGCLYVRSICLGDGIMLCVWDVCCIGSCMSTSHVLRFPYWNCC